MNLTKKLLFNHPHPNPLPKGEGNLPAGEAGGVKGHEKWMRLALQLAEKGRCSVSPNPMVGACLVRGHRVVAEGYHEAFGGPHAEVLAIKRAGSRARGATLYVTLEPCSTWGKTPPCVAAIVRAGIRNVVIGSLDPNPKNHGRGVRALKKEGVRVRAGILSEEVKEQNNWFFKYVHAGLPYVTLKMAQSLDGKIATRTGASRWISSPLSRAFVHELRAGQDAILVGKNTLFKDDPYLSPRIKSGTLQPGKPWRVVLDPKFQVSLKARIFRGEQLTVVVVSEKIKKGSEKKNGFYPGCALLPIREKRGRLDLGDLLKNLAALGIAKLLVEGGGELAWSLLEAGFVDKAYWIVAPKILGGRSAKTSVEGKGVLTPSQAIAGKIVKTFQSGEDLVIETEFGK